MIARFLKDGETQVDVALPNEGSEYMAPTDVAHDGEHYRLEGRYDADVDGPMFVYRYVGDAIPGEVTADNAPPADGGETTDITQPMPGEPTPAESVYSNPRNLTAGVTELPIDAVPSVESEDVTV